MEAHITESIKELLYHCFKTDEDLLKIYHIEAPSSLEKCAERTYNDIISCDDITIYRLSDNNETCGYFGIEEYEKEYFLTGFMLNKEYRSNIFKKEFWRLVNETIKKYTNEYFCCVYQKNNRAMSFLVKSGGEEYLKIRDGHGNRVVIYKFN